jgi:hypothetical protein
MPNSIIAANEAAAITAVGTLLLPAPFSVTLVWAIVVSTSSERSTSCVVSVYIPGKLLDPQLLKH